LTAQRLNETASMEWRELDFEFRTWVIPRGKAKSDRAHEVQLSDAVVALLRAQPQLGPYVFTGKTGHHVTGFTYGKTLLDAAMAEAAEGAKIEPFIVHDLRRSAASHMAKLGITPQVVDKILNHSTGTIRGVAAVYNRFEYQDARRAALAAWASHVTGLLAPAPSNVVPLHEHKA
jgi:integrase